MRVSRESDVEGDTQGMTLDRPDVLVDFVFDQGMLFVAIMNIGRAPAYRVRVTFNEDIWGVAKSKLISGMPLFRCLEFMPPGKRIMTFLDTSESYFRCGQPTEIETRVSYKDRRGRVYSSKAKHNLDIYRDIGYVIDRPELVESHELAP